MFLFLFSFFCSAWATPATKIYGKFQISGFSFGGRVLGEIYFSEHGEFHIQIFRPSGLSILSLTTTKNDACFLFDFDSTQYIGTHEDFAALSNANLKASELPLIFAPDPNKNPNWSWDRNASNKKLKKLTIPLDNENILLETKYHHWKKDRLSRVSIHILENEWKLKANLRETETVDWNFSCEPSEGVQVFPLEKMKSSITPEKRKNRLKKMLNQLEAHPQR